MTDTIVQSSQATLPVAQFERLLLRGDAQRLDEAGLPDAAAVARGHFDIFAEPNHLNSTPQKVSYTAARIAQQCLESCSDNVTVSCPMLHNALKDASAGSSHALFACYVAGVALLQAFIRENWAGPVLYPKPSPVDIDRSENAAYFLVEDGEDIARPARYLHWLRAAKHILVDAVNEFVRNGALLAPWWATRTLLAHHYVLSGPTPSLQYSIFTMYCRFLGTFCSGTRYLFGAGPSKNQTQPAEDEGDEEDFLLPSPVLEGNCELADEEQEFVEALDETADEDSDLLVLAHLELALAQKSFYDGDGALASIRRASDLAGIRLRIKGEMGVRTKFQTKPTAQLIARAFQAESVTDQSDDQGSTAPSGLRFRLPNPAKGESQSDEVAGNNYGHIKTSNNEGISPPLPRNVPIDDTDVLGYIKLTGQKDVSFAPSEADDSDSDGQEAYEGAFGEELENLTPLQQALTLAHAAIVRARNASHLLTKEQMAPYVELVIRNSRSPFGTSSVVQMRALMLRVTFERSRGRYLERCMSQMEEVGRFINDSLTERLDVRDAAAAERALFVFGSSLPPRWELMKELAISFGKIGLVKSAMDIFEKLEFWDELVDCHRLIGNIGAAESLVREQLDLLDKAVLEDGIIEDEAEMATVARIASMGSRRAVNSRASRRPRLLCVLGDVTRNREHFETAWRESGFRYARAKRALARACVEAGEWEEAVTHFREALALNSLFPEIWFTYGCAAIETGDMQLAAHAFTHVVQQTPDNGEAWNNLGRVLHELGKRKEALKALTEAAKTKRDSWRIWNNILLLATELRSAMDIVRAQERLLEIRGKDGIVAESVGIAVTEVIRMSSSEDVEDKALVGPVCRKLLQVLGRSTALVSTNPAIWAAYAELHELVPSAGGIEKAFDCRLKQVRSLIAQAQWKSEVQQFRHMAMASDALTRNALQSNNPLNIRATRLHLKSAIGQTSDDFKEDEGFSRLLKAQDSLPSDTTMEKASLEINSC